MKRATEPAGDIPRQGRRGRRNHCCPATDQRVIADKSTPSDNAALARIETRIEIAVTDLRRELATEDAKLLKALDDGKFDEARNVLAHVDDLRDQFVGKIEAIRADMLSQVFASTTTVIGNQRQAIIISAIVTALAAAIGWIFSLLVASGITSPVRQLLQGTREVEAAISIAPSMFPAG
jgi:adenylate cyclase